jgi:hypothetical protein
MIKEIFTQSMAHFKVKERNIRVSQHSSPTCIANMGRMKFSNIILSKDLTK